ncbi:MAG: S-methyl-5-thioribose-1-phosphate isomerase [Candidatus Eisenbacteria bacterium]
MRKDAEKAAEPKTVEWTGNRVRLIDQTALPGRLVYLELVSAEDVADAIRTMKVRGAPAIGVAAALGVALAVLEGPAKGSKERALGAIALLGSTRPTAVNLFWALSRMRETVGGAASAAELRNAVVSEATSILEEDRELCRRIGENGARLLHDGATVLTHCNAGALATAGMGTALAVVYAAKAEGKRVSVIASETRPLLQGARLTAWELVSGHVDVTVICDSAAAWVLKSGQVDCALIGADRMARNGDVANKVGSYSLSIVCKEHGVPLYVACPYSTIDCSLEDGAGIPIEERGEDEVRYAGDRMVVPPGARVYNPAFDVVPHSHVSAIITEKGVHRPPFEGKLCAG